MFNACSSAEYHQVDWQCLAYNKIPLGPFGSITGQRWQMERIKLLPVDNDGTSSLD